MYVQLVEELEELANIAARWNELAGSCVFRSWTWLATWWQHYGCAGKRRLQVLLVWESNPSRSCSANTNGNACETTDRLVAILPCYQETTIAKGQVLRLLGDGEVCSDHLDLLVSATNAQRCAEAIADFLLKHRLSWDLADFPTIDLAKERSKLRHLFPLVEERSFRIHQQGDLNTWSIDLPESWEEFLASQSKSHRKQLRRLESRVLNTERCKWHLVKLVEDFKPAWEIFVDLHQRRRQSLGESGCFASATWGEFHSDVAQRLLAEGCLRMSWLELDGNPIAAEYHFTMGRTTFAYQGGIDPDRLDQQPGKLSLICCLQHAIAEGHRKFDLLRGDESYKPHWRAKPHETVRTQIVPERTVAQMRYNTWNSLHGAARWIQQVSHLFS